VEIPPGLLAPATEARLQRALAGRDGPRHLRVGELEAGDVGILDVTVQQVHPLRPFARKSGGDGLMGRAVLSDGTGEIDLVLWGDETRHVAEGTLRAGVRLHLVGATVRAGYRGGLELGLGHGRLEPQQPAPASTLAGTVESVGDTRVVGDGPEPEFVADLVLATPEGPHVVAVRGELVKEVRRLARGAPVRLEGVQPNPALPGWSWTTPQTRLVA
jgi:hypothetical protein